MSVDEVMEMIGRLTVDELRELNRRLEDDEGWAGVREPRTPMPSAPAVEAEAIPEDYWETAE
jgi:hypothetical protein